MKAGRPAVLPNYKSMLQKAVRRREGDKAVAWQRMMALSTTELFRRVPIICVEMQRCTQSSR